MKKNKVDDKLADRTKKNYPKEDEEIKGVRLLAKSYNEFQSLYRDPVFTKILLMQLEKQYRKVFKIWSDFWDMACDIDPQYCFICGRYVLPKMRNDKERIKRPYKNGDVVHDYCFVKEMTVDRTLARLNDNAELICHADEGWSMIGKVCRLRVKNNVEAVRNHLGEFHSKEFTHEGNLEFLRAIYFLKPNGRPFRSPIV